jgi:NitT/TauT family transport system substrate-binding protein
MRVVVTDIDSPSYFVATAAVELGFFREEGIDAELAFDIRDAPQALRDGRVDFMGSSANVALRAFPDWHGARLLCALAHHTYWFLAVRADLGAKKGDISAVKGLRIAASQGPDLGLKQLLAEAGIDLDRDNVRIVRNPDALGDRGYKGGTGVRAIRENIADAYWGNGMRAELGVREGVATVLLDVRRGDGPPGARHYTFPALTTTERLIKEQPNAAAAAVRAVVKTQEALKKDPSIATRIGRRLFPPEEAELIAELVARDAPFYAASISEHAIAGLNRFTQAVGQLSRPASFEEVVATQFREFWQS